MKGNLEAVCVIIYGYIDQNLDFTITFKNVLDTIYYYVAESQIEKNTDNTDPFDEDTDGYGLNDYDKIHNYGTDPFDEDTDGDGLNDYDEIIPYTIDYKIEYLTYDVVICEVVYDPPGTEPDNELIKLCNQGSLTVDIGGWWLTDGEGTYTIPSGTTLTAGSSWSVYGSTYNPTSYTRGLYLANSHDDVILYDKDGIKVDEYHW